MPESKVVDAWAMIAWLLDQAAAPAVELLIQEADAGNLHLVMSWMNVGEVYYIISRRHGHERSADFSSVCLLCRFGWCFPTRTAFWRPPRSRRPHPVSFSDAFAIALAQAEKASVITGDDEIRRCAVVPVDWIG